MSNNIQVIQELQVILFDQILILLSKQTEDLNHSNSG